MALQPNLPPHYSFAACRYHFMRYMLNLFVDRNSDKIFLTVHRLHDSERRKGTYICGCGRPAQFYTKSHDNEEAAKIR